jgi:hypothetical protein
LQNKAKSNIAQASKRGFAQKPAVNFGGYMRGKPAKMKPLPGEAETGLRPGAWRCAAGASGKPFSNGRLNAEAGLRPEA